jgi:16S rRNA (cytosine1402-N4)-methyltransferase
MQPEHVPVLRERVVALLAPALDQPDAVWVDATLGLGGHAAAVMDRCPGARLVGIDRDAEALALAESRLRAYAERVTLVHAVYDEIGDVLDRLGLPGVSGILFDLGVSSLQLDRSARGFAYATDAPLDMRMDASGPRTAADIVNSYSIEDLSRILRRYGEERFARRIAERIVRERADRPFTTSGRLVQTIQAAIPAAARNRGGHPAKRSFQALRIEVNDELGALERALPLAVDRLQVGGRIVVMSYHSLEDRLAKQVLGVNSRSDVPVDMPFIPPGHGARLRLLTRGAEKADAAEVAANRRASSVRLRAAERIELAA